MKKIKTYEIHPAANKYPMMTGLAWEAFLEDFAEQGQIEPVKLLDGKIIDGRHRQKASVEFGKPLKVERIKLAEGQTPEQYVDSVNLHRRHLDPSKRDAMILDLRRKGASIRSISKKTGIPHATVQRVAAGVQSDTPARNGSHVSNDTPEIIGRDGKKYPAKQKDEEPDESEPPTAFSKALDKFIPIKDVIKGLQSAREKLANYCERSNPYARGLAIDSAFENIISELRGAAPHCDCPKCNGAGCKSCKDVGWTTKFLAKGIL